MPTSQSPYPRGRCECKPAKIERYADTDSDGQADDLVAVTDYLFDDAGRLTGLTHHDGATPTPKNIADYDLGYDPAGRIVDFDFTYDGTDYDTNGITYDDTNQLTDVDYDTWQTDEDYDYDDNGNRTNNGFSVGSNNQLTSDGTCTYTYDDEGNRATRTRISQDPADDYLTEYTWDHRNRLTMVTFKNNSGTATKQFEYTYDFGARWIRKTRDTDADGTVDESTVFVYDGNQIALQFDKTGDSDLAATDMTHRYLWNTSVDHLLVDEQVHYDTSDFVTDEVLWPLGDHLGSVRDVVDSNQIVRIHRVYDAFGRKIDEELRNASDQTVTAGQAGALTELFAFTGRPMDGDSGLQNNLNRWYDATVGKWITEDPIGFEAGDANLVRYVGNSPSRSGDPTGLVPPDGVNWPPMGDPDALARENAAAKVAATTALATLTAAHNGYIFSEKTGLKAAIGRLQNTLGSLTVVKKNFSGTTKTAAYSPLLNELRIASTGTPQGSQVAHELVHALDDFNDWNYAGRRTDHEKAEGLAYGFEFLLTQATSFNAFEAGLANGGPFAEIEARWEAHWLGGLEDGINGCPY
ncbi:MAG TPA: RHS repeat-associated core domain-containing protein [Thermoguttaceae bacterium]|nr:RHS repeat-associated core domain-containing protein [Thermoguttaceae bacterium]